MWWSESDSSQHTVLVLEYTYSTSPKLDSWHVTCPPSSPETPSFPGLPYNTNLILDQDNTCSGSGQNHWGLSLSFSYQWARITWLALLSFYPPVPWDTLEDKTNIHNHDQKSVQANIILLCGWHKFSVRQTLTYKKSKTTLLSSVTWFSLKYNNTNISENTIREIKQQIK